MSDKPRFFELKVKLERPGKIPGHWQRVGSGTAFLTDWGEDGIACTLETAPLNWDGTFIVVPSRVKVPE